MPLLQAGRDETTSAAAAQRLDAWLDRFDGIAPQPMNPYRYRETGDEKLAPGLGQCCLVAAGVPLVTIWAFSVGIGLVVIAPIWIWLWIRYGENEWWGNVALATLLCVWVFFFLLFLERLGVLR